MAEFQFNAKATATPVAGTFKFDANKKVSQSGVNLNPAPAPTIPQFDATKSARDMFAGKPFDIFGKTQPAALAPSAPLGQSVAPSKVAANPFDSFKPSTPTQNYPGSTPIIDTKAQDPFSTIFGAVRASSDWLTAIPVSIYNQFDYREKKDAKPKSSEGSTPSMVSQNTSSNVDIRVSTKDVLSTVNDQARKDIESGGTYSMNKAAQMYLNSRGVRRGGKSPNVQDIAVLSGLGFANMFGDPAIGIPELKTAQEFLIWKNTGMIERELPEGASFAKGAKGIDIPLSEDIKLKVVPKDNSVIIKGYVRRGSSGEILNNPMEIEGVAQEASKATGMEIVPTTEGNDLILKSTGKAFSEETGGRLGGEAVKAITGPFSSFDGQAVNEQPAPAEENKIKLTTNFDVNQPYHPDTLKAEYESEIISGLQEATAGRRDIIGSGIDKQVIATPSTFPSWIPAQYRKSTIVKPVVEAIMNGSIPTSKPQLELYNLIKNDFNSFGKEIAVAQQEIDVSKIDFAGAQAMLAEDEKSLSQYEQSKGTTHQGENLPAQETGQKVSTQEKIVPIDKVQHDLHPLVSERANKNTPKIQAIVEALKRGEELPAIPVYEENGVYKTNGDGFHRLTAYQNAGIKNIKVRVESKTELSGSAKQREENKIPSEFQYKPEPTEADKATSIQLNAGIDPHVGIFVEKNVKPGVASALADIKETAKSITNWLSPRSGVKQDIIDIIYKMKGLKDKEMFVLSTKLDKIESTFTKLPKQEQLDFIVRMEKGEKQPTEAQQAVADMIKGVYQSEWLEREEFNPTQAWKENYFARRWRVIPGSPEAKGFKGVFRKPLQGPKSFFKQSTLNNIQEGVDLGGVPYSYNPITLMKISHAEHLQYMSAQRMMKGLKDSGNAKFVRVGDKVPDDLNMTRVDDRMFKIFFPSDKGMVYGGDWYVDEGAARLINNFISRDLIRSKAIGRRLIALKNFTTAVELSISPFHFVFETIESMSSGLGEGLGKLYNLGLLQGDTESALGGLRDIVTAPVAPIQSARLGGKVIKALTKEGFLESDSGKNFLKQFPAALEMINDLFELAGGKLEWNKEYYNDSIKAFKESVGDQNYIASGLRAIPALNEMLMKPLFQSYIPRLKIGTFLREYSSNLQQEENRQAILSEKGKPFTPKSRGEIARSTWDFVENRFGEMNFDNLFWDKTFKTAMQITMRSVTWKLGNVRGMGGAAVGQSAEFINAAKEGRAPRLDPRMSWLFGLAVTTLAINYAIQKSFTGKFRLEKWQDVAFPYVSESGRDRVSIPTYFKDLISLTKNPIAYFESGLSGEIGKIVEVWNNKDFYSTQIYNPSDPAWKRAMASIEHLVPMPFTFTSLGASQQAGVRGPAKYLGFAGFTKAPGYISKTDIANKISDLAAMRFGGGTKTQVQTATSQIKSQIRSEFQNTGDRNYAAKEYAAAVKAGTIKPTKQAATLFFKDINLPSEIRTFKSLPDTDQVDLIKQMTREEINVYAWYVHNGLKPNFAKISPDAAAFIEDMKAKKIKAPVFKMGELQQ